MHYNCLIVDDEKELADMTKEYFQIFAVTCACVENGIMCRKFLENNLVDIILMDINMEDETGVTNSLSIRKIVPCKMIQEY